MAFEKLKYLSIVPLFFALSCGASSSSKTPPPDTSVPPKDGTPLKPSTEAFKLESFIAPDRGLDYGSELVLEWTSNREGQCLIKDSTGEVPLKNAEALPASGRLSISAEEAAALAGKRSTIPLQMDCEAEGSRSTQRLNIPVSRFSGFRASDETPKSGQKIELLWTSDNLQGPCKINGQEAGTNPFEMAVEGNPKTIKNITIACPGFKKTHEASLKLFILPDNDLAWYLASDFTLNSKLIDSEIDKAQAIVGHEPMPLTWKTADGVSCTAQSGLGDEAVPLDIRNEGGLSSLVIESATTLVRIECSAQEGLFPQNSARFYLRLDRKSIVAVGGISLTSMLLDNKTDQSIQTQPMFAQDSFRLYTDLKGISASRCRIGFEGEAGSGLLSSPYPETLRWSETLYRKAPGTYKAWVECGLEDGTYRRNFEVKVGALESQPCPERIIRIYDISQLSWPAACPRVSIVLLALDSLAWEPFRASGQILQLKLAAQQSLKVDYSYEVVRYEQPNAAIHQVGDFVFTRNYLSHARNLAPLHLEIEGDETKRVSRLQFRFVKAAKVTVRNIQSISSDLSFWSDERSEFNFMDLESAGSLVAAGNRQVLVNAPLLKTITGSSLGELSSDARRSRPSLGGVHIHQNMSLLIRARLESITGEFTVESNDGEVSLVPPGMTAVGVIQQPLREILKARLDPEAGLIRQSLNGSLLIADNAVLQKVLLPDLSNIEGGGVIGQFKNLRLVTHSSQGEEKFSFGMNTRLLELSLGQAVSGAHEIKVWPHGTSLDLEALGSDQGFGKVLHIVKDPELTDLKLMSRSP